MESERRDLVVATVGCMVLAGTLGVVWLDLQDEEPLAVRIVSTDVDVVEFAIVEYCDNVDGHEITVRYGLDGTDIGGTYIVETSLGGEVRDRTALADEPGSAPANTVTMSREPDDMNGQPERFATVTVTVADGNRPIDVATEQVRLPAVNQDRECRDPPGGHTDA